MLPRRLSLWLLPTLSLFCFPPVPGEGKPALNLKKLLSKSGKGYISLNDDQFSQAKQGVAAGDFSLFILFDASEETSLPREMMHQLMEEFSSAGRTYQKRRRTTSKKKRKGEEGEKKEEREVFFCVLDFKDSPDAFDFFEIRSLPHVRFVSQEVGLKGSQCEVEELNGAARSLLRCLESLSGVGSGNLNAGGWGIPWKKLAVPLIIIGVVIFLAGSLRLLVVERSLMSTSPMAVLFCLGCLFVYLFSISGMMFVIINQMPMYYWARGDPPKLKFMLDQEGQLGAEGIVAGFMYTSAGLALATIANVAPMMKRGILQRLLVLSCEIACGLAVYGIYYFSTMKR